MNTHFRPHPRWFRASILSLALAGSASSLWAQAVAEAAPAPAAAPAREVIEERWYVLTLDGAKAGWLQETVSKTAEGHRATDQEIRFALSRAGTALDISMKTGFVETDGPGGTKPVSMSIDQNLGLVRVQSDFTFTAEGVVEKTRQSGVEKTINHPKIEGEWLTPRAVEKFVRAKLEGKEDSFSFRSVSATAGVRAFNTTVKVLERGSAEAMGKVVPAVKWETEADAIPGVKNTEWVSLEGRPVRSEVEIAGMRLQLLLSDKAVATSPFKAPEAMTQTAVVPVGAFPVPARDAKSTIFTIWREDLQPINGFPVGGIQRTTDTRNGEYIIKVDVGWPVAVFPPSDLKPFLAATTSANAEDPEIIKLAKGAFGETVTSKFEQAKFVRIAVRDHIQKKNLGVGFATASEVVRTRQGDCTEHAVLLAAALRAVGIPSRVVSGAIYAEEFEGMRNVFAYHMWTQALVKRRGADGTIEDNWIDLDATLPGESYVDAARIALSVSDLSDAGTLNSMVALSEIIGKLKVRIEIAE